MWIVFGDCMCAHGDKHMLVWVPVYVHMCFYVSEGCVCVHKHEYLHGFIVWGCAEHGGVCEDYV